MSYPLSPVWFRRFADAFLIWFDPFIIFFPFYGKDNTLIIGLPLYMSLMVVVTAVVAAILVVWFFRSVRTGYTREAIVTGIFWLVTNWVLDLIMVVGMEGMNLPDYVFPVRAMVPDSSRNRDRGRGCGG